MLALAEMSNVTLPTLAIDRLELKSKLLSSKGPFTDTRAARLTLS